VGVRAKATASDRLEDLIERGDIRLTEAGAQFAKSETDERKQLFSSHLLTYVPLAAHIRRVLDERKGKPAPKRRFADELEDYMAEEAAEDEWLTVLQRVGASGAGYFLSCTPSFYNSEQQAIDVRAARNLTYSGSLLDYIGYLERWRREPDLAGVKVQRAEATEGVGPPLIASGP